MGSSSIKLDLPGANRDPERKRGELDHSDAALLPPDYATLEWAAAVSGMVMFHSLG